MLKSDPYKMISVSDSHKDCYLGRRWGNVKTEVCIYLGIEQRDGDSHISGGKEVSRMDTRGRKGE